MTSGVVSPVTSWEKTEARKGSAGESKNGAPLRFSRLASKPSADPCPLRYLKISISSSSKSNASDSIGSAIPDSGQIAGGAGVLVVGGPRVGVSAMVGEGGNANGEVSLASRDGGRVGDCTVVAGFVEVGAMVSVGIAVVAVAHAESSSAQSSVSARNRFMVYRLCLCVHLRWSDKMSVTPPSCLPVQARISQLSRQARPPVPAPQVQAASEPASYHAITP